MTLRENRGTIEWTLEQILACNGCKYEGECDAFPTWGVIAGFSTCNDNLTKARKNIALFRKEIEGLENPNDYDPRLSGTVMGVASSCLEEGFELYRKALLERLEAQGG